MIAYLAPFAGSLIALLVGAVIGGCLGHLIAKSWIERREHRRRVDAIRRHFGPQDTEHHNV